MRPRDVRLSGNRIDGWLVHIPLGRSGTEEATVDLDDWEELVSLKLSPNWNLQGGQVSSRGPLGVEVMVARVLTDARPGQRILFLNGDHRDLRKSNLGLQEYGMSVNHDRALLIEAAAEFERRKVLALAKGTYKPRFRKRVPIINPVQPVKKKRVIREPLPLEIVA
ncbi:hypothetical protein RFM99_17200 [Mesorhizobium sp. VK4C]|uniref:hypothetical protein n=1 Tax=Mesorhizobium captivum TaxID=3072319 RepID=UPI002A2483E2|nr:hypothetical protein [Mesorhizobium sp. VK4C]MDX8500148.1 hypothetical protein [Mesorhizobium sp. VK4C]